MPAYLIAEHKITDQVKFEEYRVCFAPTCRTKRRTKIQTNGTCRGVRERDVMEYWTAVVDHSGLMLAARITLAHFSMSSAMSLPKSAGEP
jgi:hypothetical protein